MSQQNGKYYSLVVKELNGHWGVQFGDWDRKVVVQESYDTYHEYRKADKRIVCTDGTQKAIDEIVMRINNTELGKVM